MKKRKLDDRQEKFLEMFDSAVNLFMSGEEYRELAERACHTHRTLQQNKMRLIVEMLQIWAKAYEDGNFDLRNEATVKLASRIVFALGDDMRYLPTV